MDTIARTSRIRRIQEVIENRLGIISISLECKMCSCQHKLHWSVIAMIVNIVAIVLFTTGVATKNWAVKTEGSFSTNTGLFMACPQLNDTCYDTHYHFDENEYEKGLIIASAILNVFALIGFYLFFALSIFFLCGLFQEKALATGAIVTAYVAGLFAVVGTVMFAVSIKRLSYSLSWSFILAVLGFIVNFAAGVLMCVGRNISHEKSKIERKRKGLDRERRRPIEEVQMEDRDTTRKKVWSSDDGPEVSAYGHQTKKKLPSGASP